MTTFLGAGCGDEKGMGICQRQSICFESTSSNPSTRPVVSHPPNYSNNPQLFISAPSSNSSTSYPLHRKKISHPRRRTTLVTTPSHPFSNVHVSSYSTESCIRISHEWRGADLVSSAACCF